jgi:3-phenylpropionate/cinnamic acid dioxygenase small subunit
MTLTKTLAVTTIVCAIGWASTQVGAQDTAAREARDRAEIEALMWRYARALDTLNADAYAAVYAPDGQFGTGANATKGHAALKKMIVDTNDRQAAAAAKGEPRPPMYHMTTNSQLTFVDKDHARLDSYYLTVFGAAGQNVPVRVAAAGRSVDQLVRIDGKWLIQSRDVAPRE